MRKQKKEEKEEAENCGIKNYIGSNLWTGLFVARNFIITVGIELNDFTETGQKKILKLSDISLIFYHRTII